MTFGEYNKRFDMVMSHELSPNRLVPFKPRGKQSSKHSRNTREPKHDKNEKVQSDKDSVEENIKILVNFGDLQFEEGDIVRRFSL